MEARLEKLQAAVASPDAAPSAFVALEEHLVVRRMWRELSSLFEENAERWSSHVERYWQRLAEELRLIAESTALPIERAMAYDEAARIWQTHLSRWDQAIACCREAVRAYPSHRPALRRARENYERTDEIELAGRLLGLEMKAATDAPVDDRLQLLAHRARLEALYLGRRDEALDALARMEALDPDHPHTHVVRGLLGQAPSVGADAPAGERARAIAGRAGEEGAFLAAALEMLASEPASESAMAFVRVAAERANDAAKAAAAVEALLADRAQRTNIPLIRLAGDLRVAEGALDAAEPHFRRIRLADARDEASLRYFARFYRARADWRRLQPILQSMLERSPSDVEAIEVELASVIEHHLDTPARAIEIWNGVLRRDPARTDARHALRRLLRTTGGWTRLVELLREELSDAATDADRVALLAEVATIYETQLSMASLAMSTWNDVLSLDPEHAGAHRMAARRASEAGDWDAALASWRRVHDAASTPAAVRVEAARGALAALDASSAEPSARLPWFASLLAEGAVDEAEVDTLIQLGDDGEGALAVASAARLHRALSGRVENVVDELRLALREARASEQTTVARRCLEALSERDAVDADELEVFADELAAAGDHAAALDLRLRQVERDPDNVALRTQTARDAIALERGDVADALLGVLAPDAIAPDLVEVALQAAWKAKDWERAAALAHGNARERDYFDLLLTSTRSGGIEEMERAVVWARDVLEDREDELDVLSRLVAAQPADRATRARYEELLEALDEPARLAESIQFRLSNDGAAATQEDAARLAAIYGETLDAFDAAWRAAVVACVRGRVESAPDVLRWASEAEAPEEAAAVLVEAVEALESAELREGIAVGFARAAMELGEIPAAVRLLEQAVGWDGMPVEASVLYVDGLARSDAWEAVPDAFVATMDRIERVEDARALLAALVQAVQAGVPAEQATGAVVDATTLFAGDAEAFASIEAWYVLRGEWAGLAAAFAAGADAAEDAAGSAELLRKRAMVQESRLEDADGALETWSRVAALEPDDADTWVRVRGLAEALDRADVKNEALQALRRCGEPAQQADAACVLVEQGLEAGEAGDALMDWIGELDLALPGLVDAVRRIERETGSRRAWDRLEAWFVDEGLPTEQVDLLEQRVAREIDPIEDRAAALDRALVLARLVAPERTLALAWSRWELTRSEAGALAALEAEARGSEQPGMVAVRLEEAAGDEAATERWAADALLLAARLYGLAGDEEAALLGLAAAAQHPDTALAATLTRLELLAAAERWEEWFSIASAYLTEAGDDAPESLLEARVRRALDVVRAPETLLAYADDLLARRPDDGVGWHARARAHARADRPAEAADAMRALTPRMEGNAALTAEVAAAEIWAQIAESARWQGLPEVFADAVERALATGFGCTALVDALTASDPLTAEQTEAVLRGVLGALDATDVDDAVEAVAVLTEERWRSVPAVWWSDWADALEVLAAAGTVAGLARVRAAILTHDLETLTGLSHDAEVNGISLLDIADLIDEQAMSGELDDAATADLLHLLATTRAERIGDWAGASEAWTRMARIVPDDARATDGVDRALDALGRWDELVDVLRERAFAATDDHAQASLLARTAHLLGERLGRPDDAIATARMALESDPLHTEARRVLATLLRTNADHAELASVLEQLAADLAEGEERDDALDELAAVRLEALGDAAGALDALRALMASPSGTPRAVRRLHGLIDAAASGQVDASWGIYAAELMRPHLTVGQDDAAWETLLAFTSAHAADTAMRAADRLLWLEARRRLDRPRLGDDVMRALAEFPASEPIARLLVELSPSPDEAARILELSAAEIPTPSDRAERLALAAEGLAPGMERARLLSRAAVEACTDERAERALEALLDLNAEPQAVGLLLALADRCSTNGAKWLDRALPIAARIEDGSATVLTLHERLVAVEPTEERWEARRAAACAAGNWRVVEESLLDLLDAASDEETRIDRALQLADVRVTRLDDADGGLAALEPFWTTARVVATAVDLLERLERFAEVSDACERLLELAPEDAPRWTERAIRAVARAGLDAPLAAWTERLAQATEGAANAADYEPAARALDEETRTHANRMDVLASVAAIAARMGAARLEFEAHAERVDGLEEGEERAAAAEAAARLSDDQEMAFLLASQACVDATLTVGRVELLASLASTDPGSDDVVRVCERYVALAREASTPEDAAQVAVAGLAWASERGASDAARLPLLEVVTSADPFHPEYAAEWMDALERTGDFEGLDDHLERCRGVADDPVVRAQLLDRIATVRADHLGDIDGALDALEAKLADGPEDAAATRARMADLALRLEDAERANDVLAQVALSSGADDDVRRAIEHALYTLASPGRASEIATSTAFVTTDEAVVKVSLEAFRAAERWDDVVSLLQRSDVGCVNTPELQRELAERLADTLDDLPGALRIIRGLAEAGDAAAAGRWVEWAERSEDARECIDAIGALLELDPTGNPLPLLRRRAMLLDDELGDEAAAAEVWARVAELDATDAWAWDRLLEAARAGSGAAAVVDLADRWVAGVVEPAQRDRLCARAVEIVGVELGASSDALALGLRLFERAPSEVLLSRLMELDLDDAAMDALTSALGAHASDDESPLWPVAAPALASLLVRMGRVEEATPLVIDLIGVGRVPVDAARAVGPVLAESYRWLELRSLLAAAPSDDVHLMLLRAQATEAIDGAAAAADAWLAAAAADTAPFVAWVGAGRCLRQIGRMDEARTFLQRALLHLDRARTNDEKADAYDEIALVHEAMGDASRAERDRRSGAALRKR